MLTRPPGPWACSPPPSPKHLPRKGRGDSVWSPGITSSRIPRPAAARPRPPPPGRALPGPARPCRGCGPYLGGGRGLAGAPRRLDTGGWRRGGCYSPCSAARLAAFVCKHPARLALPGCAAPPPGAGRAGWREGPHETRATRLLSGPARPQAAEPPSQEVPGPPAPPSSPTLVLFTEMQREEGRCGLGREHECSSGHSKTEIFSSHPRHVGKGKASGAR